MADTSRYSQLPDGRLLDSEPMEKGQGILVFSSGKWVPFEGTLGEWRHSKALTASEVFVLIELGIPLSG